MASSVSSSSRSSTTGGGTVHLRVGNTYRRLPQDQAPWNRSGTIRKVHDWTLYVDIQNGSSDVIESVTFDLGASFSPSRFVCHSPIPVTSSQDGRSTQKVMRFCTRQQTYGPTTATIKIRGLGGTVRVVEYPVVLSNNNPSSRREVSLTFTENNRLRPLRSPKMPDHQQFGIELELTSSTSLSLADIAAGLSSRRGVGGTVQVVGSYHAGRETAEGWKLVPDSSIYCSASQPDCNTFELVSPVLKGGEGLGQVNSIIQGLGAFGSAIKVNKSMGFHVHIDVSQYSVAQLVKICQQFVKYEDVMDTFMPLSRRTGSAESNQYFRSNRSSVGDALSNRQRHTALGACADVQSLAAHMNRGNSRYYKLNLQNLVTGRQPTLEFRQHSATTNYDKIAAWVRFCTAFVTNAARLAPPTPFARNRSVEHQTEALFFYVIKDRALRDFYRQRRGNLKQDDNDDEPETQAEHCCRGCAAGSACSRTRTRVKYS